MTRHGKWNVSTSVDEQPDYNYYNVEFADHGTGSVVARVLARVYLNFGEAAKDASVERLDSEALQGVPDSELLEIAEQEINTISDFQIYVPLPGVVAKFEEK